MKPDQIRRVKLQCDTAFGQKASEWMLSNDPQKLSLIIEKFNKLILDKTGNIAHVADIIFKWICITLSQSSNTPLIIKIYDLLSNLFSYLMVTSYRF